MAKYTVIIQPEAEADLDEAFEYLENIKPNLGFGLLAEVSDIIGLLEDNPYLFQIIEGQKRRVVVKRFKYNLFYKIKGDYVYILAILHGGKSSKWWKTRR